MVANRFFCYTLSLRSARNPLTFDCSPLVDSPFILLFLLSSWIFHSNYCRCSYSIYNIRLLSFLAYCFHPWQHFFSNVKLWNSEAICFAYSSLPRISLACFSFSIFIKIVSSFHALNTFLNHNLHTNLSSFWIWTSLHLNKTINKLCCLPNMSFWTICSMFLAAVFFNCSSFDSTFFLLLSPIWLLTTIFLSFCYIYLLAIIYLSVSLILVAYVDEPVAFGSIYLVFSIKDFCTRSCSTWRYAFVIFLASIASFRDASYSISRAIE